MRIKQEQLLLDTKRHYFHEHLDVYKQFELKRRLRCIAVTCTWSGAAIFGRHGRQVLDLRVELQASVFLKTRPQRPVERLQEEALHDVILLNLAHQQRVEHVGQLTHLQAHACDIVRPRAEW